MSFKYRLERVPIPNEISQIDENYPIDFIFLPFHVWNFK